MGKIERVEDTQNTPEVFENDIDIFLHLYCEECEIEDLRTVSQNIWTGCLRYICKNVFRGTDKLKLKGDSHNSYDVEMVDTLCNYYLDLCSRYDKIPSITGFCYMLDIDTETINNWAYVNNAYTDTQSTYINSDGKRVNVTSLRIGVYKKLNNGRAEGLESRLVTGQKNPVGILGALNHYYGWNMPGVSREVAKTETQSAGEIADKYGSSNGFLPDNSAPNAPE